MLCVARGTPQGLFNGAMVFCGPIPREKSHMRRLVMRFLIDESGATAIEYGLIAALIAVASIGGARALGTRIGGTFNNVSNSIK
jgi:pilus assembly protein Flp/PilA